MSFLSVDCTSHRRAWNGDNTKGGAAPGGLPTFQEVNRFDVSVGGKLVKDRVWFFATYRYADLKNGISRTEQDFPTCAPSVGTSSRSTTSP